MFTQVKFTFESGDYLIGNLITDGVETKESISQKVLKRFREKPEENCEVARAEKPTPIPPNQIKIHEFTLFNQHGTKIGHGSEMWTECDQVIAVGILSPTKV